MAMPPRLLVSPNLKSLKYGFTSQASQKLDKQLRCGKVMKSVTCRAVLMKTVNMFSGIHVLEHVR